MDNNERREFIEKSSPVEVFWSRVSDAICDEEILLYLAHTFIDSFRSTIDDQTHTARSIDEKSSWKQIKNSAEKDGLNEFAEAITFIDGMLGD